MVNELKCSECGSKNLFLDEKNLQYICMDCNPNFKENEEFRKLNIFLSCGHDEYSIEVLKIKEDLVKEANRTMNLKHQDWKVVFSFHKAEPP